MTYKKSSKVRACNLYNCLKGALYSPIWLCSILIILAFSESQPLSTCCLLQECIFGRMLPLFSPFHFRALTRSARPSREQEYDEHRRSGDDEKSISCEREKSVSYTGKKGRKIRCSVEDVSIREHELVCREAAAFQDSFCKRRRCAVPKHAT